jgi:hypothetical protein
MGQKLKKPAAKLIATSSWCPVHHSKCQYNYLIHRCNSQAVRIPAELAYSTWDVDLVIERQGDELRIRPA